MNYDHDEVKAILLKPSREWSDEESRVIAKLVKSGKRAELKVMRDQAWLQAAQ